MKFVQGLVVGDLLNSLGEFFSVRMKTFQQKKIYFDGLRLLFQILFNIYLLVLLYDKYKQDTRVVEIKVRDKFLILMVSTVVLLYTAILFIQKHQLSLWLLDQLA